MGYLDSDGLEKQIQYIKGYLRKHGGIPIGHEYFSVNPNIPQGSLPLFGGEYSRETYADLWTWVQAQSGYLKTEAEWQTLSTSNNGNVPFYSSGDGSTTFRVPSLRCWVKGADGTVVEVGNYREAGLPNITGKGWNVMGKNATDWSGAFYADGMGTYGTQTGTAIGGGSLHFDASRSSSVYGKSSTVQPESIVGMWLVKAYGTIEDTGTIDEQQYIDDRIAALPTSLATTFLPLAGGTMTGEIIRNTYVVKNNVDNSYTEYLGGKDETSSYIVLYGKSHSTSPGRINLRANNGTNNSYLTLDPNGRATWGGKEIERINSRGSNSNGDYIRYENGIQICWGGFANVSVPRAITYPAAFNTNSPAIGIDRGTMMCSAWSATGCNITMVSGGTSTGQYLKWIAIGTWK